MRAILQKVSEAEVSVFNNIVSEIKGGLLILLGVSVNDTKIEAEKLAKKISGLRIFTDSDDKLNFSVLDVKGEILAVSQFTLYADCRKGRRPSFIEAAPGEKALPLFEYFVALLEQEGLPVKKGVFGEHMEVKLINDGPTTIILDSEAC